MLFHPPTSGLFRNNIWVPPHTGGARLFWLKAFNLTRWSTVFLDYVGAFIKKPLADAVFEAPFYYSDFVFSIWLDEKAVKKGEF